MLFDCIKTTFRLNVGVGSTTKLTQEGVQFLTILFDCIKTTFRLNVGVGSTTKLTQEGVQFLTILFDCLTVLKLLSD